LVSCRSGAAAYRVLELEGGMNDQLVIKQDHLLDSIESLRRHYRPPNEAVVLKTVDRLDDYCRTLIAASPFAVLATGVDAGLDCSPKGDEPGFVQVLDEHTLLIPDRPGNNRIDGLTNIVRDPRVGLIFLIPGLDEALRVNGRASISVDPALLQRFERKAKLPVSVIVVRVTEVFMHCGRAISTAGLWDADRFVKPEDLPNLMEVFHAHVAYSRSKLEAADGESNGGRALDGS
jgi:PPOX class probable FMN-dependent enzyme